MQMYYVDVHHTVNASCPSDSKTDLAFSKTRLALVFLIEFSDPNFQVEEPVTDVVLSEQMCTVARFSGLQALKNLKFQFSLFTWIQEEEGAG